MCLAIPGKIEHIPDGQDELLRVGEVSFGQVKRDINLSMVPDAKQGDYVLVHVGVAISIVDEKEAKKTFEYIMKMGELDELQPENDGL